LVCYAHSLKKKRILVVYFAHVADIADAEEPFKMHFQAWHVAFHQNNNEMGLGYTGEDDGVDASALPKDYVSFAFSFTLQTGSLALMLPTEVTLACFDD
jgi:hypothetical protein